MITVIQPDPKLSGFIDYFWTLPHCIGQVLRDQELMTPCISIELIFNSRTPKTISLIRGSNFIGKKKTGPLAIEFDPDPIFGIKFKTNGLYPFSKFSLSDFELPQLQRPDHFLEIINPADILGIAVNELAERMFATASIFEKLTLANNFFSDRLARIRPVDHFTDHLISEIATTKGSFKINKLSEKYNIHKKTIERRFLNATGLNPKTISRIIRFNHILPLCNSKNDRQLADAIFSLGYYDHSHFQRDFKSFTQLTPAVFFSRNYQVLKAF